MDDAKQWSPEEVARRWFILFPSRDSKRKTIKVTPEFIKFKIQDIAWVEVIRERYIRLAGL